MRFIFHGFFSRPDPPDATNFFQPADVINRLMHFACVAPQPVLELIEENDLALVFAAGRLTQKLVDAFSLLHLFNRALPHATGNEE